MLDPTTARASAARPQARARQRRRDGKRSVRIDIDHELVVGALIDSKRLSEDEALDHANVERAVAAVVEDWAKSWPRRSCQCPSPRRCGLGGGRLRAAFRLSLANKFLRPTRFDFDGCGRTLGHGFTVYEINFCAKL